MHSKIVSKFKKSKTIKEKTEGEKIQKKIKNLLKKN